MNLGSSTTVGLTLTLNSASRFVGKMLSIKRKQGVFCGNAPGAGVEQSLFPCQVWPGWCPAAVGYLEVLGVLGAVTPGSLARTPRSV